MDNWIYSRDFPRGEKHYIDRIGNSLNILNKMIHIHNLYLYTLHYIPFSKDLQRIIIAEQPQPQQTV